MEVLERDFYTRPTLEVARDLIGMYLVHRLPDQHARAGRIVETEAYLGPSDAASHARFGQHGRAARMYGPAGFSYVYLIYGIHTCFNAVTEPIGNPGAVLVRALELTPAVDGGRGNGPGLLCRALGIGRECNGQDLTGSDLFVASGDTVPDSDVQMGPRIGVESAGAWAQKPWRFWEPASKAVSRQKRGLPFDPAVLRS